LMCVVYEAPAGQPMQKLNYAKRMTA
jgi:hypothetical protein